MVEYKKLAKAGSDSASWRASALIWAQTKASSSFSSTSSAFGEGGEWLSCPGICFSDDLCDGQSCLRR